MKTPLNWIKAYVDLTGITPKEFQSAMTMSGSKVEGVEYLGEGIRNVVFGKALCVEHHPDADKLFVCQIDIGTAEPLQIITGADNVRVGDVMPVALDDSDLPCGKHIKAGLLRGLPSNGMLCSADELGVALSEYPGAIEHGILILPKDECFPLGEDCKEKMGFEDHVVEFEITSNRPDCLSVLGLAREAAATFDRPLREPETKPQHEDTADDASSYVSVRVEDGALCPRYIARVVKDVKIGPSPKWMRQRLRAAGVRPINNIVDITNYVMLEYGQPMHAFDQRQVKGSSIVVRRAKTGEQIRLLDDVTRTLDESMLVIADDSVPTAVAGVMGGEDSGIHEDTRVVVFESANFYGPSVRITAKKLGLRTEASSRFEKGLDPNITELAADRACRLCEELGCGTVVAGRVDVDHSDHTPRVLALDYNRVNRFLGTDIPHSEMVCILEKLHFKVQGDQVTVPTWRTDVLGFADLAEEIARIYGYHKIPSTLFAGQTTQGKRSARQLATARVHQTLLAQGCFEIMTYSFIGPKEYDKIAMAKSHPLRNSVVIQNPLGEDTSIMRTTTLPSMLQTLALNYNHRNQKVRLYEIGRIYLPQAGELLPREQDIVTIGCYDAGDYYDLKGVCENLFARMNVTDLTFEPVSDDSTYHPGRCAAVLQGEQEIARLGQIHPLVAKAYGFDCPVYCATIMLDVLAQSALAVKEYTPLPRFPAVSRDLALLCEEDLPVSHIEQVIRRAAGKQLEQLTLFDVYQGKQVEVGKKSVAYSLTLRSKEKTMTEEEVDRIIGKIMSSLDHFLGIKLRT